MDSKYNIVSFNKLYLNAESFEISAQNRAFRYGDGFFETMHANGLQVQFFNDHFDRILYAVNVLKLALPDYFTKDFLHQQISGLLSRCKLFQAARVKITFFRSGEGLYAPKTNKADFIIEAIYLGKGPYELNSEALTLGIFDEIPKPKLPYSHIKSINAQLYVLASIFANENRFDDVLLVDNNRFIVEATSSNFYLVKENTIVTPALESGCVNGVMRRQIISIVKKLGYVLVESNSVEISQLREADELFLSNAVIGLKSISGFENRRYYNRNAKKIVQQLNAMAFNSNLGS